MCVCVCVQGNAYLSGSGYCMMQLGWEGEALTVDEQGSVSTLPDTVLNTLTTKGVK